VPDTNKAPVADIEEAKRQIAECDRKLGQYRAAPDDGGNAATIGKWIAETEAQRATHALVMHRSTPSRRMSEDEIQTTVDKLGSAAEFRPLASELPGPTEHPSAGMADLEAMAGSGLPQSFWSRRAWQFVTVSWAMLSCRPGAADGPSVSRSVTASTIGRSAATFSGSEKLSMRNVDPPVRNVDPRFPRRATSQSGVTVLSLRKTSEAAFEAVPASWLLAGTTVPVCYMASSQ
jgi:hypothetical protein